MRFVESRGIARLSGWGAGMTERRRVRQRGWLCGLRGGAGSNVLPRVLLMSTVAVVTGLAASCGEPRDGAGSSAPETEPESARSASAPSLPELEGAEIRGIYEAPVRLEDGVWEGEPFVEAGASRPSVSLVPAFRLVGDLDDDGLDEAVVLLSESSGGSGTRLYLAVVDRTGGEPSNVATVLVGDRVQVRRGAIDDGRIFLDVIRQGPEDPACCPTQKARLGWSLSDADLKSLPPRLTGTLTIEDLGGSEWLLRWWTWSEQAPTEPEITFAYLDGRIAGSAGCNRYFADVTPGEIAREFELGPIGATRKACSPPTMSDERRFLSALQGARGFSFVGGRLALSFVSEEGDLNAMIFEERGSREATTESPLQ
jgi:heat shock protein HslJ